MAWLNEKMVDWTNEFTFEFLEMYKAEGAIWDPTHPDHKKKEKVVDAWVRLSERTGKPVHELKRKKDSLMATFRMHWRRKKASIKAGCRGSKIYRPIWFAYEYMDGFLGPLYKCDDLGGDALDALFSEETPEEASAAQPPECVVSITDDIQTATATSSTTSQTKKRRKRHPEVQGPRKRYPEMQEPENQVAIPWPKTDAFENCDKPGGSNDECDLYGKILAKRLRKLPEFDRQLLMHDIDGMVLEAMQRHRQSSHLDTSSLSWHSTEPQAAFHSPYALEENYSQFTPTNCDYETPADENSVDQKTVLVTEKLQGGQ